MSSTKTLLNCSTTTTFVFFTLIGSLFILVGCSALYRAIGLTDEQAAAQLAKDQAARQEITNKLRLTITEIILTITSGLGALASGFLAKWLNTERKITTALITGIESAEPGNIKKEVQAKATAAGVESALHARVLKLT